MELFDLTMPLGAGTPVHPGDSPLAIERTATHQVDGFEVARICLGSHLGTHVEGPRHFFPQGKTLDRFPLSRFAGPGVILDCRPKQGLTFENRLAEQLRLYPPSTAGVVLLWTSGEPLTLAAAELLVEAEAGLVGIDAPSVDEAPYQVHRYLLSHEVLVAENLVGLERLGAGPVQCCLLPVALEEAEAAPARAVAWK